jgi:phosphopantetheinyl transferase (holo-ACP synthase)
MSELFRTPPFILEENSTREMDEWIQIAKNFFQGAHPNRLKEWSLARIALKEELARQKISIDVKKTEIEHYQKFKGHPEWMFSLSHTRTYAGAWVLPTKLCLGLGLDLELKDRKISPEIQKRMLNSGDAHLDPLTLWSVKEAVYKSLPQEAQERIWLNSIRVRSENFSVDDFPHSGEWKVFSHPELFVTAAARLM